MKVRIDHTLYIDDDELRMMADILDEKQSKRKASRAEVKEYVWRHGSEWEDVMRDEYQSMFELDADDDDLLGTAPGADDDLLGTAPGADDDDDDLLGTAPGADDDLI